MKVHRDQEERQFATTYVWKIFIGNMAYGWIYVWMEFDSRSCGQVGCRARRFYYLIHPADFLDENDLNKKYNMSLANGCSIEGEIKVS